MCFSIFFLHNAPNVAVNSSKLTLNTTTSMEYYDETKKTWVDDDKTMTLEVIATNTLAVNGSKSATLQIRSAATASKSYSKTAYIMIKGQAASPSIGDKKAVFPVLLLNGKIGRASVRG